MRYERHPYNIFPRMGDDDRKRLTSDIKANGYDSTQPVYLYEGKVLDGINRCEICAELGVEPVTREFHGTPLEAIEFVMRTNKRRNLTSSQWAAIAAEADDMWAVVQAEVEEERRRKQAETLKATLSANDGVLGKKLPKTKPDYDATKTSTHLAQNFNTNRTYVNEAKKYRETDPETFEQIKAGKLTINRARTKQSDSGDEWYTPQWLFDALGLEFDMDVCAPVDLTHVTTPAKRYLNIDDDGLAHDWIGLVWCNPPYSEPSEWAAKMVAHGNGLLLSHIPMNAEWCTKIWQACDGIRLFQAIEFVRPDGARQRPGMWLQLAAFGPVAKRALADLQVPDEVAENPRRVPSPMWERA